MNDYPPTLLGNIILLLAILTGAGAGIVCALWLTRHWTTENHDSTVRQMDRWQ